MKFPCKFFLKIKNEFFVSNGGIFDIFELKQNSVCSQSDFYAVSA